MSPQFVRFVNESLFPELEATHTRLYAQGLVRSPPFPLLTNCTLNDFVLIVCGIVSPTNVTAFRNLFLSHGMRLVRCSKPGVPNIADFTAVLGGIATIEILVRVLDNKLGIVSSFTSDRSGEPSMIYSGGSAPISFPSMILELLGPVISPSLDTLHEGNRTFAGLPPDPLCWRFSADSSAYLNALKSLVVNELQSLRYRAFDDARYESVTATPHLPPVPSPILTPSILTRTGLICRASPAASQSNVHHHMRRLLSLSGSDSVSDGNNPDCPRSDRPFGSASDSYNDHDNSYDLYRAESNTRALEPRTACYNWSKYSACHKGFHCTFSHDPVVCLAYLRSQMTNGPPRSDLPLLS